jgi:tRNA uridine 5-carboxymethylaminomethyl modification enzyme
MAAFEQKQKGISELSSALKSAWFVPKTPEGEMLDQMLVRPMAREVNALALVARPELNFEKLKTLPKVAQVLPQGEQAQQIMEQVEICAKYSGYIDRQVREVEKQKLQEDTKIPSTFKFAGIPGLSKELQEKLSKVQPTTIGMASRIPGMTPSAISILLVYLKARKTVASNG